MPSAVCCIQFGDSRRSREADSVWDKRKWWGVHSGSAAVAVVDVPVHVGDMYTCVCRNLLPGGQLSSVTAVAAGVGLVLPLFLPWAGWVYR